MKQAGVQSGNTTTSAICADILLVLQRANTLEKKLSDNHASIVCQPKSKSVSACGEIVSARKRLYGILGEMKDLSYRIKDHIADNIIDKLKDSRNISWVIKELQLLLVHILQLESTESKLKRTLQELPKNNNNKKNNNHAPPFPPKKPNTQNIRNDIIIPSNPPPPENNNNNNNNNVNHAGLQPTQNENFSTKQQKGRKLKNYQVDNNNSNSVQKNDVGGPQVNQNMIQNSNLQLLNNYELGFCYPAGLSYPGNFYGQDQVVVGAVMQYPQQQYWQQVQNFGAMQQQIEMQQFQQQQQQQQQQQIQHQFYPPLQFLPGYPVYAPGYYYREM